MDRDSKIIIKRYIGIFALLILLGIMWLTTKILWLSIIVTISIYIVIELLIWKITNYRECKPKKLLENKYYELKLKDNLSLYEKLYVNGYNGNAKDILMKVFRQNNINSIHNLAFDIEYNSYIMFTFNYKRHNVHYFIYEDKVDYYISAPDVYSHLEINKEHEKLIRISITINNYDSLESYFSKLIPFILENINDINLFEENVSVFNINKLSNDSITYYQRIVKKRGILTLVLTTIITIIISLISYFGIKNLNGKAEGEIISELIALALMWIFMMFCYVYSIYYINCNRKIEKDSKYHLMDSIVSKPYMVRFITDTVGYRPAIKYCIGIKLYFNDNNKLKLIFANDFNYPSKEQKKEIINKIVDKEFEFKYYKNSKMIVDGAEQIRKHIKKVMRK